MISTARLQELYDEQRMSVTEIAEKHRTSFNELYRYMCSRNFRMRDEDRNLFVVQNGKDAPRPSFADVEKLLIAQVID